MLKNVKTTGEKTIYVREQRFERSGYHVDCPVLHFGGKWLEALGFHNRSRVRLQFSPGRILITTTNTIDTTDDKPPAGKPARILPLYDHPPCTGEPSTPYQVESPLPTNTQKNHL